MPQPKDKDQAFDPFYVQALLAAEVVRRILKRKGELELSNHPTFVLKPITEFSGRMRVTGLAKFEEKTFIGTVNFYLSVEDLAAHHTVGALILYIPETYIVRLLQDLGYPVFDEDDEEALEDATGTFCNLIAGNFKSGLTQMGYQELQMSHFLTFQNDVLNGIEYHASQTQYYEIGFEIKDRKRLIVDLTVGPIPQTKEGSY